MKIQAIKDYLLDAVYTELMQATDLKYGPYVRAHLRGSLEQVEPADLLEAWNYYQMDARLHDIWRTSGMWSGYDSEAAMCFWCIAVGALPDVPSLPVTPFRTRPNAGYERGICHSAPKGSRWDFKGGD